MACLCSGLISGQGNAKLDSLRGVIRQSSDSIQRAQAYLSLGNAIKEDSSSRSLQYAREARALLDSAETKLWGKSWQLEASANMQQHRYEDARDAYTAALFFLEQTGDSSALAHCYSKAALPPRNLGDYEAAINYSQRAITLFQSTGESSGVAAALNTLAIVHYFQNQMGKTMDYFQQSLLIHQENGDSVSIAKTWVNIGIMYKNRGALDTALVYYEKGLEYWQALDQKVSIGVTYVNLGNLYQLMEDKKNALFYYNKALEIFQAAGDKRRMIDAHLSLGSYYHKEKQYQLAESICLKGLTLAKELGLVEVEKDAHGSLAEIAADADRPSEALKHYRRFMHLSDSLSNIAREQEVNELNARFEADQKQKENDYLSAQSKAQLAELERKQVELERSDLQRNAAIFGAILLLGLGGVILVAYRQKRKANELLAEQKNIIQEKNNDILASISYARRLQEAILPPDEILHKHLPDSFILYQPRDIVSGDFYWLEVVDDLIFFAVADCTGHGVPGAMLSVVGANGLNRSVKEFGLRDPAAILDQLSKIVEEAFSRSGNEVKDGMDVAMCVYDPAAGTIKYAGANNPLWLIRNYELQEFKATKQSIGYVADRRPFESSTIKVEKGDLVYLFSDGYADQFGGPAGKKFKSRPFKNLLQEIAGQPVDQQRQRLHQVLKDWKGDLEQVDDICVIGVRI